MVIKDPDKKAMQALGSNGKSKNYLRRYLTPVALTATSIVILLSGTFVYFSTRECPLGKSKANFISCDYFNRFSDVPASITGEFQYGGSTSLLVLADRVRGKISEAHPSFSVAFKQVATPSEGVIAWSGEGIQELIDGEVDIAFSSRELTERELESAAQKGVKLEAIPVAKSGLAFFVAEDEDRINSLTLSQIKETYTDFEVSSGDLGIPGETFPITRFSPDPVDNQGEPEYFQKEILENDSFSPNVETRNDITQVKRAVSEERGRIGFADVSLVCLESSIKPLQIEAEGALFPPCTEGKPNVPTIVNNTYPLTRKLFVIIRRDGTQSERAGIAYINMLLSNQGQQIVLEVGYVPVRSLQ